MPCSRASAATFSALRPTRIGSGITRSPFGNATPPCVADGEDRADQMLVQPHAPGDAVHDDAEPMRRHDQTSELPSKMAAEVRDDQVTHEALAVASGASKPEIVLSGYICLSCG